MNYQNLRGFYSSMARTIDCESLDIGSNPIKNH